MAKDQDEISAVQGWRLGNVKGPSLLVRTQVISHWPVSHSRGAWEWSIQVRSPGVGIKVMLFFPERGFLMRSSNEVCS